jgi:hypothetical protein
MAEVLATSGARKGSRPWIGVNNFVLNVGDLKAMNEEATEYLTVTEAAALLDVDRKRVSLLVELGYLKCVDHAATSWPGKVAVSKASVDRFRQRFATSSNLDKLFPELRMAQALHAIDASLERQGSAKFAVYAISVIELLRNFEKEGPVKRQGIAGTSRPTGLVNLRGR